MRGASRVAVCTLAFSAVLLAGCSSSSGNREDSRYATLMETADSIFNLGHVRQARQQYAAALERAFLANDAQAIHDAGFNLATSDLRLKAYGDCLATVGRISAALKVRGWSDSQQADLHLVRAAALYGQKQWRASEKEASLASGDADDGTRREAYGLVGLDEAELGEKAGLEKAIRHLTGSTDARDQANLEELLVQRDMLGQHWQSAAEGGRLLAGSREEAGDYEAMRRALGLQARALQAMGKNKAAQHVLRQLSDSRKAEVTP